MLLILTAANIYIFPETMYDVRKQIFSDQPHFGFLLSKKNFRSETMCEWEMKTASSVEQEMKRKLMERQRKLVNKTT